MQCVIGAAGSSNAAYAVGLWRRQLPPTRPSVWRRWLHASRRLIVARDVSGQRIMSHAAQHRDATHRRERRRTGQFNDWTEPFGSSADEMQKAYFEICRWLNEVDASRPERFRQDSIGM